MKLFNSRIFLLIFALSLNGCASYSHSTFTNIRQESFDKSYEYLKTESLLVGFDYLDKQTSLSQSSNPNVIQTAQPLTAGQKQGIKPLTGEQKKEIPQNMLSYKNSSNSLGIYEPTFLALATFAIRKYGENAVVGNVVWDVKITHFFWDVQKFESVTFDVYLKRIGNSNTVPDRPEPTSPTTPARSSPSTP